jgi:hypothetical protein
MESLLHRKLIQSQLILGNEDGPERSGQKVHSDSHWTSPSQIPESFTNFDHKGKNVEGMT